MVYCSNCKYCEDEGSELRLMSCIYCYATDEYIDNKCAMDDLPCEFYDEKLDDYKTQKP